MRKQIALLAMALALPVFALSATDGDVHGAELKKAQCTYVMATSVLKEEAGAGIWLAPFPDGEKCAAVK